MAVCLSRLNHQGKCGYARDRGGCGHRVVVPGGTGSLLIAVRHLWPVPSASVNIIPHAAVQRKFSECLLDKTNVSTTSTELLPASIAARSRERLGLDRRRGSRRDRNVALFYG